MLFFCMTKGKQMFFYKIINLINRQSKIKEQIKKYKSLQVRISLRKSLFFCRKRVSFSASMTVEAAFVIPLFLFAGVILMMPFRILSVERQVQAYLEVIGEELSQMASVTEDAELVWFGYAESMVRLQLQKLPIQKISLASSKILQDGEWIDLVVDYEMQLPFSVLGLKHVKRTACCYRRGWIGQSDSEKPDMNTSEMDEIVYVGKDSSRYHVNRECHYLSNRLQAVAVEEIDHYRNTSGGRYQPCSRCGQSENIVGKQIVYIMKAGESYHTTKACSAIQAYVTAVQKSQVLHLGGCSYCSRGDGG